MAENNKPSGIDEDGNYYQEFDDNGDPITPPLEEVIDQIPQPEPDGMRVPIYYTDPASGERVQGGVMILNEHTLEELSVISMESDTDNQIFAKLLKNRDTWFYEVPQAETEEFPDTIQGPEIQFDRGEVLRPND